MADLGTYTMSLTDDGNGVVFSAKPSPLAIITFVTLFFFPPYTLLFFLTVHALLGNSYVLNKCDPLITYVLTSIKSGGTVVINNAKDLIQDMGKEREEIEYDIPVEESDDEQHEEDDYPYSNQSENGSHSNIIQLQSLDSEEEHVEDSPEEIAAMLDVNTDQMHTPIESRDLYEDM